MVEKVVERSKEPEPSELLYEFSFKYRAEYRRQRAEGAIIIKDKDAPWEQNRQGYLKHYCHPKFWTQQAVPYWYVFRNRIRTHSGKHRHQGGLGIFVLEGKGYTVVDGVRYDWEKDDLILLPVKPEGCEHQHFNTDPSGQPAEWLAFIFSQFRDALGDATEQREVSPDWKGGGPVAPIAHMA